MKEALIQLVCFSMGLLNSIASELGAAYSCIAAGLVIYALEPTNKDKQ